MSQSWSGRGNCTLAARNSLAALSGSFGAMLVRIVVRMVAVDFVGTFDEQFYLAWDNVDWCVRLRALGWGALVVPGSRIFYKGTGSIRGENNADFYYGVRNSLLLAHKHACVGYWSALACVAGRHLARAVAHRNSRDRHKALDTVWAGLRDHWRGFYGVRGDEVRRAC